VAITAGQKIDVAICGIKIIFDPRQPKESAKSQVSQKATRKRDWNYSLVYRQSDRGLDGITDAD
jgi:hypothetical protein